jgi:hypothetical protein
MITFSVSNNFETVRERIDEYPDRITGAMRRATTDSTRYVSRHAAATMEERAGGVYWDINELVAPMANGAQGRVRTPPSKPHRIEPTKSHGLLVFEIGGETIFVRGGVDHPGSNPLDWITSIDTEEIENFYDDEVGRVFGLGAGFASGALGRGL